MSKKKLKSWTDIYPQGCKEGDEEQGFFIALSRHPKWTWRSVSQISKESALSKQRVEEIIQKYHKRGMIFQSPSNDDMWGYWENHKDMIPEDGKSVTSEDHKSRMEIAKSK
ncbi:MAG: helix-turn-helix domain-containing protein [Chryseobacterium sp.]